MKLKSTKLLKNEFNKTSKNNCNYQERFIEYVQPYAECNHHLWPLSQKVTYDTVQNSGSQPLVIGDSQNGIRKTQFGDQISTIIHITI